jgi:hypothetical protein
LAKYDPDGGLLWVRHSAGSSGSFSDESAGVEVSAAGEVYLGGSFGSTAFLLAGQTLQNPDFCCSEFFVAKFSSGGDLLWVKQSQGAFATEFELSDIALSETGGVTATGVYINSMGSTVSLGTTTLPQGEGDNVFTAHYSASGDLLWARGVFADNTSSAGIADAGSGSVIVAGVFAGEFSLDAVTLQSVPQDFSPNMYFLKLNGMLDGTSQVFENQRLNIYPNPAGSFLEVETPDGADGLWLRLTDAAGQQVLREKAAGKTTKIELPHLTGGAYFLLLENVGGVVAFGKVFINN